jgi:hypothetical protein
MWLPQNIVAEVDRVARIRYLDREACRAWNEHREPGELRLLSGWCWASKSGARHQFGLKTMTAAYRDAWYVVVAREAAPGVDRRLRVVRKAA